FMPWAVAVAWAALHRGSAVTQIQWIGQPEWADLVRFYAKWTGGFPLAGTTAIGLALFLTPVVLWTGQLFARRRQERELCATVCLQTVSFESRTVCKQTVARRAELSVFILLSLVAVVPAGLTFSASYGL